MMADKEGMERKVYLLPEELVERIKAYQGDQGISSEVEAARRLLDAALQMRDTVETILMKMRQRWENEKDLRILAKDILTSHSLVVSIEIFDSYITFRLRNGTRGAIDTKGKMEIGDSSDSYMQSWQIPQSLKKYYLDTLPKSSKNDLDDDNPF